VLRILLSRRILGFTALVLLLIPIFLLLGQWQWERFEQRVAADRQQQDNVSADPVEFEELSGVGVALSDDDRWRAVTATGRFDSDHELLVRNRTSDHGPGFYVLTPLVTEEGTGILVNRGWVARAEAADEWPEVPAAPSGEVTVRGRAQISETEEATGIRERDGLPEGQVMLIDVPEIADDVPYPLLGGFVEAVELIPEPEDVPVPAELDGYNWGLNLAYAVQWWVFTAMAVGGWVVLVRRERRREREEPAE
jgi:cytochrome oxidase assembly protein ShyY1